MGGGGGKSKRATAAPAPMPVAPAPVAPDVLLEQESAVVQKTRDESKKAAQRARGRASTILTGSLGDVSQASVERKTLLGQ